MGVTTPRWSAPTLLPSPLPGGPIGQDEADRLLNLLAAAIPEDERQRLENLGKRYAYDPDTKGAIYSCRRSDPTGLVASYNNTRKTPQEIIDWYKRAQLLA